MLVGGVQQQNWKGQWPVCGCWCCPCCRCCRLLLSSTTQPWLSHVLLSG